MGVFVFSSCILILSSGGWFDGAKHCVGQWAIGADLKHSIKLEQYRNSVLTYWKQMSQKSFPIQSPFKTLV